MTILIVDDNEQNLYQLQVLLGSNKYQVVTAVNGEDALAKARQNPPDLIISDVLMPIMDGFTLCRECKKDKRLRSIPFVFYTATYTDDRDREFALSLGAERFLVKPEEPETFIQMIHEVIRQVQHTPAAPRHSTINILPEEETGYLQQYNTVLLRKLEAKTQQLEQSNRELEQGLVKRKEAEAKIHKLYAMQETIRQVNEALLRSENEEGLYQKMCDLLVNIEGVMFAWIGLAQKENTEIRPVAKAGHEKNYLSVAKFTRDESEYGQGPAGLALRTSQPCIIDDIESDDRYKPWRQEAKKRGFTSVAAIPLMEPGGTAIGVLSLYAGTPQVFGKEEVKLLLEVAADITVGMNGIRLAQQLSRAVRNLKKSFDQTIEAISLIVSIRDPYTSGHERKVAQLSREISREMGFSENRVEGINVTAFLHDIGKIMVPAEILTKPGCLNNNEFNLIKMHPQTGHDVLKGLEFPWPLAEIILQHHERLNGSGYPSGLKGEQIYLEARIIAVADVVEAMASHRPYREALGIECALEEIVKNKGILYDPAVVDACLAIFKKGFKFQVDKT